MRLNATTIPVSQRVPLICSNAGWLGKPTSYIKRSITIVDPSVTEGRRRVRTLTEGIRVVRAAPVTIEKKNQAPSSIITGDLKTTNTNINKKALNKRSDLI